jgi:hypothetical protein
LHSPPHWGLVGEQQQYKSGDHRNGKKWFTENNFVHHHANMMETEEGLFVCKLLPSISPSGFAKIAMRQFGASGLAADFFRQVIDSLLLFPKNKRRRRRQISPFQPL